MIEWFTNNYQWLLSGAGVIVIGWLVNFFINRSRNNNNNNNNSKSSAVETTNSNTSSSSVVNNIFYDKNAPQRSEKTTTITNMVSHKNIVNILFIDDEKFNMVNILKTAGWAHTAYRKDIVDLEDPEVLKAHIIFVDIYGVGTKLFGPTQGRGLAGALKDKYPNKKIVLYSAENNGNIFDEILRKVDACLPKNAEPYQFISLVDQFAQEIIGHA